MTKYAIFFRLPFEKKSLCIYEYGRRIFIRRDHVLSSGQNVVCLNLDDYFVDAPNCTSVPQNIFDMNLAVRVLNGLPASNFNNDNAPWKGIRCLGRHFDDLSVFAAIKSIENGNFGNYADWLDRLPAGWSKLLISALKKEHQRLISELTLAGLLEQFTNVEMPLKRVFAQTGIEGIDIDNDKLYKKYCTVDNEYFKAVKDLEITHGFVVKQFSNKICYDDIKEYIPEFNSDDFNKKYFWESVEMMQETSPFLKSLLIEHRNRWDLGELLRVSSSISGRCRIDYDVFGTVTGRILLNKPGIQYLKKTSRGIFSPRDGHQFIYADYSQFEPGILAWISGDTRLIELYNSGDIYTALADAIAGGCPRKIAKEIFLSFIYGMSRDNIKLRINRNFGEQAGLSIDSFLNQFSQVEQWRKDIIAASKENKAAKGPFGYIRKITDNDTEKDIERWVPNHVIQSTATGIFKKALLEISENISDCRMLVPMHDAILIECPNRKKRAIQNRVENIMIVLLKVLAQVSR